MKFLKRIQENPGDGPDNFGMLAGLQLRFYMVFSELVMMNRA